MTTKKKYIELTGYGCWKCHMLWADPDDARLCCMTKEEAQEWAMPEDCSAFMCLKCTVISNDIEIVEECYDGHKTERA